MLARVSATFSPARGLREVKDLELDHRTADHDFEIGKQSGADRARRPGIPGRTTLVEAERWPAADDRASPHDPRHAAVHDAIRSLGSGASLAPKLQQDYSARLGVDLGGVRVHTG